MTVQYDGIDSAIEALRDGRAVIVVEEGDRETECDLVSAAELATSEGVAFIVRHSSGILGLAMPGDALDRLGIPPVTPINQHAHEIAMGVSVDARDVVGNGASATDRATTVRALARPDATRGDFVRPGHVFPYRAVQGGVLRRGGGTEAAVDLLRIAGMQPAAMLCELVNDEGALMDAEQARAFADAHGMPLISITHLIAHRMESERAVERVTEAWLPTDFGQFRMIGYRSLVDGSEHVALVAGEIGDGEDVLVRVHAECLLGDVVGSTRCNCAEHLHRSLERIQEEGRGILVYVRAQAAQGSGMLSRLAAYGEGRGDESHRAPTDPRNYGTGSQILADLGVHSMRLLTATPGRSFDLSGFGLVVAGVESLAG